MIMHLKIRYFFNYSFLMNFGYVIIIIFKISQYTYKKPKFNIQKF